MSASNILPVLLVVLNGSGVCCPTSISEASMHARSRTSPRFCTEDLYIYHAFIYLISVIAGTRYTRTGTGVKVHGVVIGAQQCKLSFDSYLMFRIVT